MSQLATIITNLAGVNVTVPSTIAYGANKTPLAYYLDSLPNQAPAAALPMRLIRAKRSATGGGHAFHFEFGNAGIVTVTWRVYDVLLWREADSGAGVASHEADLVAYVDAYTTALQVFYTPTAHSRLVSADFIIEVYEFPEGSEKYYAGVEVALDIEERLVDTMPAAWG